MADDTNALIVPFKEAQEFLRQKISLPSKDWRDLEGRAHDRAFVVAGAMQAALIEDLRAEVKKAVDGEITLTDFRKSFDRIVALHGWTGWTGEGSERGRAWRTRVIFETNLTTAYAAGRYAQMTDPDTVKVWKWWRYTHAYHREPNSPRRTHLAWDGTVLAWNDPWWDTHYPPNDWYCSCGVEVLSDRDLKDEGITPDASPATLPRRILDPKTGETVMVPQGIGLGWDHAPGQDWSRGLVPKELQMPLPASGSTGRPSGLTALNGISLPFKAKRLADGVAPEDAVDQFLAAFGATRNNAVLYRDASGGVIPISMDLFTSGKGAFKGGKQHRHLDMPLLAETILDPDEIWLDWVFWRDTKQWKLARRYLRGSPDAATYGAFHWNDDGWHGSTIFNPKSGDGPDHAYLEMHRTGALLWRRPEKK